MNLNKLVNSLEEFFDLSGKKQKKKRDKLIKIINKLENKKANLKKQVQKESKNHKGSKQAQSLCREFKVVTKLLKKATKHKAESL
jgi:hypothetical protein